MLKNHEVERANEIIGSLQGQGLWPFPGDDGDRGDFEGPFGRTLQAITIYRDLARDPEPDSEATLDQVAELICLYAVGIVRGDGVGIAPFPRPPVTGEYGDPDDAPF